MVAGLVFLAIGSDSLGSLLPFPVRPNHTISFHHFRVFEEAILDWSCFVFSLSFSFMRNRTKLVLSDGDKAFD